MNRALRRAGRSPFIADGAEQIVADAYAARVAGLPAALAAQDKAIARQLDRYYADYLRYHVLPELWPQIAILALKPQVPKVADALQARWQGLLATHFGEATPDGTFALPHTLKPYSDRGELSLESVQYELAKAVSYADRFLAGLVLPKELEGLRQDAPFSQSTGEGFATWHDIVAKAKPIVNGTSASLGSYRGEAGHWDARTWRDWADLLVHQESEQQAHEEHEPLSAADLEWLTVLYAGGWVMESPGNSSGPK